MRAFGRRGADRAGAAMDQQTQSAEAARRQDEQRERAVPPSGAGDVDDVAASEDDAPLTPWMSPGQGAGEPDAAIVEGAAEDD